MRLVVPDRIQSLLPEGKVKMRATNYMTKLAVLTVALSSAITHLVFGDQKIDAGTWQAAEKFDPATLSNTLSNHIGKTIAVQFNFRGKDIHHIKPNWYEGSLWQPDANARKGFSAVRVIFAKKDFERVQDGHLGLYLTPAPDGLRPGRARCRKQFLLRAPVWQKSRCRFYRKRECNMVKKLLLIGLTLSLASTARMAWGVEKLDAITWHGCAEL